jgi:hypothetical protein
LGASFSEKERSQTFHVRMKQSFQTLFGTANHALGNLVPLIVGWPLDSMGRLSDLVDEFLWPKVGRRRRLVAGAKMLEHALMWPAADDTTFTESIAVSECLDFLTMIDPVVGRELKLYWIRRDRILQAAVLGHEYHMHILRRVREIAQMATSDHSEIAPE